MAVKQLDLIDLSDRYNCKYYAEFGTDAGDALSIALRTPFQKLYSMERVAKQTELARLRFIDNDRVQIFHYSHPRSFFELLRLVPIEAACIVWLHLPETISDAIKDLASLRPAKKDIIVIDADLHQLDPIAMSILHRYYLSTHELACADSELGPCIVLVPIKR